VPTYAISPILNNQIFDSNGNLYVGAKIFTYLANTSTKANTFKDISAAANHTNPIILTALGMPPTPVYLQVGISYKFVLAPPGDSDPPSSPIFTWDNILVVDPVAPTDQWVSGTTPTYISGASFSVVGDQTSIYHVGRRVRMVSTIGTFYGWITTVAFTSITTVTVVLDSGSLDATLHTLSYSILTSIGSSVPNTRYNNNDMAVARDLTVLGDIVVVGEDIKADTGGASSVIRLWTRVSSVLSAAFEFIKTTAFKAIFTHANSADRTYTLPNRTVKLESANVYSGPTATGSGSTSAHEGDVTIASSQALSGVHYYTNFTLDAGNTLTAADNSGGLCIIASESITINGTIDCVGAASTGGTGGASAITEGDMEGPPGHTQPGGGGGSGGAGGGALFLTGGRGGSVPGVIRGGTGGNASNGSAGTQLILHTLTFLAGGAGGGGGGGSIGGGGGGRGGGSVVLIAPSIILGAASVLNTSGGAGGAGIAATNGGGGGGGGSGNIGIFTLSLTNNGCTFTQNGGSGGAGVGTGNNGGAGAAGVLQINQYPSS